MMLLAVEWNDARCRKALGLMPAPLFRPRDAFKVMKMLNLQTQEGMTFWNALLKRGWIVRTGHKIGNFKARCYWERVSGFDGSGQ